MNITGDGLTVVIKCDPVPMHGWLAFADWYALGKNLPDAKVELAVQQVAVVWDVFSWAYRLGIKIHYYNGEFNASNREALVFSPLTIAIRDGRDEVGPVSCKSDAATTFVSIDEGCGKFNPAEWIDRPAQFHKAVKKFRNEEMTSNEMRVLEMWDRCYLPYLGLQ